MKIKNIIAIVQTTLLLSAWAQEARIEEPRKAPPDYYPINLGAEAGTTGFGGMVAWRFHRHFGIRGGMHYFSYDHKDNIEMVTYDATLRLQSEPLAIDIYPWLQRSFRISAGILINQNQLTGDSVGTFEIEGTTYANESLTFKATQDDVCPYLSIGGNFFYFDRAHRWSLSGELGVAYTGSPDIILTNPTGGVSAADLAKAQQEIDDEVRDFKFWPVIKLSLNFRF
jgi:hypothetical protein